MNLETETALLQRTRETNDPVFIPVVFFSITDLCNSKCTTCDYWKTTEDGRFLNPARIVETIDALSEYHPKIINFTGGEPLLKAGELFGATSRLRQKYPDIQLRLYTNGILMHKYLDEIIRGFNAVNVPIDSFDPSVYTDIRGVNTLSLVVRNVRALRARSQDIAIRVNTVIQRRNYRELPQMVEDATGIGATYITFRPLDYRSKVSFGRTGEVEDLTPQILTAADIAELRVIVETMLDESYLAKRPILREKGADLQRLVTYYEAASGLKSSVNPNCDVPKTNIIVDAYGHVKLCFFIDAVGSLQNASVDEILKSEEAKTIKQAVQEQMLETCQGCICPTEYRPSSVVYKSPHNFFGLIL